MQRGEFEEGKNKLLYKEGNSKLITGETIKVDYLKPPKQNSLIIQATLTIAQYDSSHQYNNHCFKGDASAVYIRCCLLLKTKAPPVFD
jgi:hypothetical protein